MNRLNDEIAVLISGFNTMADAFRRACVAIQILAGQMIVNRRTRKAIRRGDIVAATWYLEQHISRRGSVRE